MFGMCELDKDFLWGGASAANQVDMTLMGVECQ